MVIVVLHKERSLLVGGAVVLTIHFVGCRVGGDLSLRKPGGDLSLRKPRERR